MAVTLPDRSQFFSTPAVMMLAISSVASPIGAVIMAQYGLHALFYYLFVIIFYFIASTIVFSELGSGFPQAGGLYNWVKQAFGGTLGNMALWSQWLGLIFTFPLALSFTWSALLYAINPALSHDHALVFYGSLFFLLLTTVLSLISIRFSAKISYIGALCLTIIPVIVLIVLASLWLLTGHYPETQLSQQTIIPRLDHLNTLALLGATVFMFAGIELTANCIQYMRNPKKQYPIAIILATIIIAALSILGTLSINVLVPQSQTSIVAGLIQAFVRGADMLHIHWLAYIMAGMLIFGSTSVLSLYLVTLAKGLQVAAKDRLVPKFLAKENARAIPTQGVLTLAFIALILLLGFMISPTIHAAYWMIEAIVVIVSSIRYLLVFPAAIKLRYSHAHVERLLRVPFGKLGMWCFAGVSLLVTFIGVVVTFLPPAQFSTGNPFAYDGILIAGTILCLILPLIIQYFSRQKS